MTTIPDDAALKPCRGCGAECRIESFGGGVHCEPWTGYVCSNARLFGGNCPDENVYVSALAWNTRVESSRPVPREASDDDALVERAALTLCEARGEDPVGEQVRFVDGGCHSATFLEIARRDVRVVLEASRLSTLVEERDGLRALISEESIERLATDIAIACVDCRDEIREARHRAMVRLGKRLREPLKSDLQFIRTTLSKSGDGG